MEKNKKIELERIVVCIKCGALYDLYYIDNVKFIKNYPKKFECKNCGMVDVVFKCPNHLQRIKLF